MSGQSGSGLPAGPRHGSSVQASLQATRPQPRSGRSEGCFSRPDTSPVNKQSPLRSLPKQTPQQSAVPRPRQNCLSRPDSKPRLQARPPMSHVTLLFREARECALFWVPRGSDVTRSPSPGFQAHSGPRESPRRRPMELSLCYWPPLPPRQVSHCQPSRVWPGLRPPGLPCSPSLLAPPPRWVPMQASPIGVGGTGEQG